MKEYKVEVIETLSRVITVDASTKESAIDQATLKYESGEIELGYDDYQDYKIGVL